MANFRPMLLMTLVFLGYLLWVEWQKDYGPQPVQPQPASISDSSGQTVPPVPAQAAEDLPKPGEAVTETRPKSGEGVPELAAPAVMTG